MRNEKRTGIDTYQILVIWSKLFNNSFRECGSQDTIFTGADSQEHVPVTETLKEVLKSEQEYATKSVQVDRLVEYNHKCSIKGIVNTETKLVILTGIPMKVYTALTSYVTNILTE